MLHSQLIISYLELRCLIGVIALLHPVILVLGGVFIFDIGLQPSMSDYYWTGMRDVFVGIDFATGIFFLCYKGYNRHDRIVAVLTGVFAILVALFPVVPNVEHTSSAQKMVGLVHAIAAISFMLCIAYFCLVLFIKSDSNQVAGKGKRGRNILYRFCGVLIVLSIVCILSFVMIPSVNQLLNSFAFIFWMEITAFWAFGIAWLVKGRVLSNGRRRVSF